MDKTSENTRKWIVNDCPTFTQVISKFPPLKDFGFYFQRGFNRNIQKSSDFILELVKIAPKIMSMCETKRNPDLQEIVSDVNENAPHDKLAEMVLHIIPYIITSPLKKQRGHLPS